MLKAKHRSDRIQLNLAGDVCKTLGQGSVNWQLEQDIIGIYGQSGAGKTSFLKALAGMQSPLSVNAHACLNEQSLSGLSLSANPCVYVGEDTPLFAHLSLRENLSKAQALSIWSKPESNQKQFEAFSLSVRSAMSLDELIGFCELEDFIDKPASALSSGERQRGKIARALASNKPILLLDEALSAMDAALRERMQIRLRQLCKDGQRQLVFVSHSLQELLLMSDVFVNIKDNSLASCSRVYPHTEQGRECLSALEVVHIKDDIENGLSVFALSENEDSGEALIYTEYKSMATSLRRLVLNANALVIAKLENTKTQTSMINCLSARLEDYTLYDESIASETGPKQVRLKLMVLDQVVYAQITKKSFDNMNFTKDERLQVMFKALR